jgi:hypothetical protein
MNEDLRRELNALSLDYLYLTLASVDASRKQRGHQSLQETVRVCAAFGRRARIVRLLRNSDGTETAASPRPRKNVDRRMLAALTEDKTRLWWRWDLGPSLLGCVLTSFSFAITGWKFMLLRAAPPRERRG